MEQVKNSNIRGLITGLVCIAIAETVLICLLCSCGKNPANNISAPDTALSKENFRSVPDTDKLWVYYWWLKGNVTKESITHDLEEMKKNGIGGFLLIDSRGYYDGYYDTLHIPVPLHIKLEFMSPDWREMVKYTMRESARLGLEMSINLANTGGALRGPWDLGQEGPKKLIWTSEIVHGPAKIVENLKVPTETRHYQDISLIAVKVRSKEILSEPNSPHDLNNKWNEVAAPGKDASIAEKSVSLKNELVEGQLNWNVPEGDWKIIRFGLTVFGDTGSVDILNREAVIKYFNRIGSALIIDAGPLVGKTLKYFYNVSWEGPNPNWTKGFEQEFFKFRGYEMTKYMPALAGMIVENHSLSTRFMRDYFRTVSDCFRENCYRTIGQLCHERGVEWHSENGGPWSPGAPMFNEADMLTFWGENDIPQGEFWSEYYKNLPDHTNSRYTSMAAHIYGKPVSAIEAFTNMNTHYAEYPAFLKPYADKNFIDGSNMFIWHTFTASPPEIGIPGYEYFAGTHLNPRVTWWKMSGDFIDYLGRCQNLLRQGDFVADICSYVSDNNKLTWGRGTKWVENSALQLNPGYTFDLLNTDVLVNRLTVKDGKLVLPGGMNYKLLVVDLTDKTIPAEALEKIIKLVKNGATIVLGQNKPDRTSGLKDFPRCDKQVVKLADKLWGENNGKPTQRKIGKGFIISGTLMEKVLNEKKILPDFEGPFEYIHRNRGEMDIYFLRGTGHAECTFRIDGKKPEIWNPVTGIVSDAMSYRVTSDKRTVVTINLPENGSVFVVFQGKKEQNYITSTTGPEGGIEIRERNKDTLKFILWKTGNYSLTDSKKKSIEINNEAAPVMELTGPWDVSFSPGWGAPEKTKFNDLIQWNNHPNKGIKYYSGIATYKKVFNLTSEQSKSPGRLQLGKVFIIARVRMNGKDLGVVWTDPWAIDISNSVKSGENELEIEVTNCWVNRLIGDAGLLESKRFARTNIRLLPVKGKLNYGDYKAFSAIDPLRPSGLIGPVWIDFGKQQQVIL